MRPIVILPVAAAALAAGAIGAWSLGLASSRAAVSATASSAAVCSPGAASEAIALRAKPYSLLLGSQRYRAEMCSGDYVCGEEGAWEVVALPAVLPAMRQ